MTKYALYNDKKIINVVIGDNKEDVEEATGMTALETDGSPWIDWELQVDGTWRPPAPYASWSWDGSDWNAPVPMPEEGSWQWDEGSTSWIEQVFN